MEVSKTSLIIVVAAGRIDKFHPELTHLICCLRILCRVLSFHSLSDRHFLAFATSRRVDSGLFVNLEHNFLKCAVIQSRIFNSGCRFNYNPAFIIGNNMPALDLTMPKVKLKTVHIKQTCNEELY
jgi:hypothetical protein